MWHRINKSSGGSPGLEINLKLPVLVIADYAKMLQVIGNLLKQLGIRNVDEAFGGITALELLRVKNYSLIIAEDVMAPIGGLDVMREVRGDSKLKITPFLLITDQQAGLDRSALLDFECFNYIQRPFNAAGLKSKIVDLVCDF